MVRLVELLVGKWHDIHRRTEIAVINMAVAVDNNENEI
jgi:hypothetical protein